MQTHNLIQGSQQWHEFRSKHFGASEAAAMLGLSKQLSRNDLLLYKKTGKSKEYSDWVQKNVLDYGHEVEALAREIIESEINDELYPVTCSDGMMLSASCDGLTIDGNIAFEHKQYNSELANFIIANQTLPDTHMPQCQQILLVTGAKRVIFVCSDGTESNRVVIDVYPDQSWFKRISAGWSQFEIDLATYEPKEFAQKPEPSVIMQLPALSVYTKGDIAVHGNLDAFKEASDKYIASINKDLKTDEDFVNAEAAIKRCKEVEQTIKTAKSAIIGGISSVDEATRVLDYIDDSHAKIRLTLEKLVKSQKESIKSKIIDDSFRICSQHMRDLSIEFPQISFGNLTTFFTRQGFETACKGLRTLSSLHNAVDTEVAAIKIKLDELARVIRKNITHLPEDLSLFRDLQSIITKPEDDFKLLVESRLAEQKRKEEEAEIIAANKIKEAEERGRAQAAAAQERERIAEQRRIAEASERMKQQKEEETKLIESFPSDIKSVLSDEEFQAKKLIESKLIEAANSDELVQIKRSRLTELLFKEKLLDSLIDSEDDRLKNQKSAIESLKSGVSA
ncbi:MAG: YqaJ viral recombinase family protein [Nitrosomonas sp.]|nr:YqaJ viral recombinase family protein [Nitrosomonas sp.]